MEFTKSIGKGDFNFEARPNDVLFLKKKEKKKRKKGESKEEVLSEVSRLDGRKRGIKENLVQTKSQLYVYSCRYTLLPRIFPR